MGFLQLESVFVKSEICVHIYRNFAQMLQNLFAVFTNEGNLRSLRLIFAQAKTVQSKYSQEGWVVSGVVGGPCWLLFVKWKELDFFSITRLWN